MYLNHALKKLMKEFGQSGNFVNKYGSKLSPTALLVNLRLIRLKIDHLFFVSPVASKDRTIRKYTCTI